jgi:hypothetical protein
MERRLVTAQTQVAKAGFHHAVSERPRITISALFNRTERIKGKTIIRVRP